MTAWAHLPNAAHIDHVLVHLARNSSHWDATWDAARDVARDAARDAARGAAWDAVWAAAWDAVRDATWDAAWNTADAARDAALDAARAAVRGVARGAAWDAICALIAYDDCAYLLDQTPDFVRGHINLTNEPAAILLLPAIIAIQGEHHGISI